MPDDARPSHRLAKWLGDASTLLYPGLVSVLAFAPVGLIGPLAFAMREDFDLPASVIGSTYSLYYIASAIFAAMGSRLLGRFSAQGLARFGLIFSSLSCLALAFSWDSGYVIVMCVISGTVNGVATPALNLVVVETLPEHRHGLGFGIRVASIPASASLAMLGAFLVSLGACDWRSVFVAHAVFGAVILAFSLASGARRARAASPFAGQPAAPRVIGRPTRPLVMYLIGTVLASTGTFFFPAFLVDALADGGLEVSTAAAIVGIVGWLGILTRILVGMLSDRVSNPVTDVWLMVAQLAAAALGMVGLMLGSGPVVLAAATFAAFALGWGWPGLMYHAAIAFFPRQAVLASSLAQTGIYIGTMLGSLVFGVVAEQVSYRAAWIAPILITVGAILAYLQSLSGVRRARAGNVSL